MKLPFYFSIFILFFLCPSLLAQHDEAASLEDLLKNPDQYNSTERVLIFNNEASKYYSKSLDSVVAVFEDMTKFGELFKDDYVIGTSYGNIGMIKQMQGDINGNIDLLKKGIPFLYNYPKNVSQCYGSIASSYNGLGQLDSAQIYIDLAEDLAHEIGDSVNFSHLQIVQGDIKAGKEQYHSALDEYLKALDFIEYTQSDLKIANIYLNISNMYSYLDDLENAEKYLVPANEIAEENQYSRLKKKIQLKFGKIAMKKDDYTTAKDVLQRAVEYLKGKKNYIELHKVYSDLAISSVQLNEVTEARKYLGLAKDLIPQLKENHDILTYHNASYRLLQKEGKYQRSISHLESIMEIGEQKSSPRTIIHACSGLSKAYEAIGNYKRANAYLRQSKEVNKSMFAQNQRNLLYDLDSRYESELKEASINQLNAENEVQSQALVQKKRENFFYLSLLGLALLAIGGFFYAFKLKQKSNEKLSESNQKLSKSLDTNKMLLKEIHHRVKNNLQVVSSLLGLQGMYMKDEEAIQAIQTGKTRVQSMSLLHQKLYQKEDIKSVNIKDYFENLILNLFQTYKVKENAINLNLDVDDVALDVDTVVPMGLIINELVSNALKYAFDDDKEGALNVRISKELDSIIMSVSDNGPGLPFTEIPRRTKSLGMQLIKSFTEKLDGKVEINSENGANFIINFPIKKVNSLT